MLKDKTYLKVLFSVLITLFIVTLSYAIDFSKKYPLPITSRISLDAKLKFVREKIDVKTIDTLIVGSSLGLNNVRGEYLAKASAKSTYVLNLSAYSVMPLQIEQILLLSDAFPNLKRIIYSGQYSDFPHPRVLKKFDAELLKRYISDDLNPLEYEALALSACRDIAFCLKREEEWQDKHGMNNKFSYLGFDATGSVPLNIYGKDIVQHRWRNPHPGIMNGKCFEAVARMAKKAKKEGIKFYFVQQSYRKPLAKKDKRVQGALDFFAKKISTIMKQEGGYFLNLHNTLQLNDSYFADRSHLNDKGSILAAEAIGRFIDEQEK